MSLIWSEIKEPSDKIGTSNFSHGYNHITTETPLGILVIDWKGWKNNPSYDIQLHHDDTLIQGTEYSLEEAKLLAEKLLIELTNKLIDLLNLKTS